MSKLKTKLMVSLFTGKIDLVKVNNKGIIDGRSSREDLTFETVRATMDWFRVNNRDEVRFKLIEDGFAWLFYTEDERKAEKIMAILNQESEEE